MLKKRWKGTFLSVVCLVFFAASLRVSAAENDPRFTESDELIRPQDYREWILAGASLGMSYEEEDSKAKRLKFHNVYLAPSAYRAYQKTGQFPEKTILVLELREAVSQSSINRRGHFQGALTGVEAAVKDSSRFPEKWAYFSFTAPDGKLAEKARAFPKERCWSCHQEHAAVDNVFTQFYPALRREQ